MVRTKQPSPKAAPTTSPPGGVSKTKQSSRPFRPPNVIRELIRPYLDGIDLELISVVRGTMIANLRKIQMQQEEALPTGSKRQENVLQLANDVEYCETSKDDDEDSKSQVSLDLNDLDDEQKVEDNLGDVLPYSIQRKRLESRSLGTGGKENSPLFFEQKAEGDGNVEIVKIDFKCILKDAVQRQGQGNM